ncbi:MAG TPA: DUF1810 domain-containing protein [Terracidiphilus sp.]|nr:DUF1810 domain-containing protein [Terracidiphilus sp.]
MSDPFHLARFVDAQSAEYEQVLRELRAGRKHSHWIWFIFPQLKGLGRSSMAEYYGIGSRDEAAAYLAHPVLGPRLRECTELVNRVEGRTIDEIFGFPDNLKFRSSMTLFAQATGENQLFQDALSEYFGGEPDTRTIALLH